MTWQRTIVHRWTRRCLLNYSWDCMFLSYEKMLRLIIRNSMYWFAMTNASDCEIAYINWEKRSWIEGEHLFLLCNKSSVQTQLIQLVSITVFTAPWHKPSKGLYKLGLHDTSFQHRYRDVRFDIMWTLTLQNCTSVFCFWLNDQINKQGQMKQVRAGFSQIWKHPVI